MAQTSATNTSREDVWVPSVCRMCGNCCGVKVHRVNGVVVKIEGHPDNPHNSGRICAKGLANIMGIYDPGRPKTPMVRTNPEKGPGIDPKWREATWEEALDLVASGIKKVVAEDPRKLVVFRGTGEPDWVGSIIAALVDVLGTPNWAGGPFFATHVDACYLINGTMHVEIDLPRCKYLLLFGSQRGGSVGHDTMRAARQIAEARARGMKLVVVDPMRSPIASQANEWVPIRPGTDGAMALAIANVLVNELGMYDGPFLQKHTNAPYLVRPDGRYAREKAFGKPLMWDTSKQQASPYDSCGAPALEGTFQVDGMSCQPAFAKLKERLEQYTPEAAEKATTVPASTIRRLAREFGEAASIGSTTVIEGHEMPYRPACTFCDSRGLSSHQFGLWGSMNVHLLNLIVGALDMPGGSLSTNAIGPGGKLRVEVSNEGLAVADSAEVRSYPPRQPQPPQTVHMRELLPLGRAMGTIMMNTSVLQRPDLLPYKPEMLILNNFNMMMSGVDPATLSAALRKFSLVVVMSDKMTETAEMADVFLPMLQPAQRMDFPMNSIRGWINGDQWYYTFRQPVLPAEMVGKHIAEVYFELAERLGILDQINARLSSSLNLKGPLQLSAPRKYSAGEVLDRSMKSMFDEEHGLQWFREKSFLAFPRTLDQKYPRGVTDRLPRVPIYFEFLIDTGQQLESVVKELGLDLDTKGYQALPCWHPCSAQVDSPPQYDMLAVNYKLAFHSYTMTQDNPWLAEVADRHPYAYKVVMNQDTAARKGIKDGDPVVIETAWGHKEQAIAKLSQCIHPEVAGIAGSFGHWSTGRPLKRRHGIHFNSMVPYNLKQVDAMAGLMDACVRVKVSPARG